MTSELFWRPVVVSARSETRNAVVETLRSRTRVSKDSAYSEFGPSDSLLDRVVSQNANICFIDVTGEENRALELARKLADQNITVVALHTVSDADLILRCLRAGVHEFLHEPFN